MTCEERSIRSKIQKMVNLFDILKYGIKGALKENWGWAVCHQCVKFLLQSNTYSSKHISLTGIHSIEILDGGSIAIINSTEVDTEAKVVESIGLAVYKALDYGLPYEEEQDISTDFENLIFLMTKDYRQSNCEDCVEDDEGYDGTICSLAHVMEICEKQIISITSDPDRYYKSMCQSLIRTLTLQNDPELDENEYKDLWELALEELRQGLPNLKHVETCTQKAYKPTQYQLLMKDIMQKKYNLKQACIIPPVKNAHDQVLEFVKSRPTLSPAHNRVLPPPPIRSKSVHERLVAEIQNIAHVKQQEIQKLTKPSPDNVEANITSTQVSCDEESNIPEDLPENIESPNKVCLNLTHSGKKHYRKLSAAGKNLVKRSLTFQEMRKPSMESLTLTIDEITHVRKVLSRAQLEIFRPSKQLYQALKTEKICFICRVQKFSIFSWSYTCQICERKVCWNCVRKVPIRPDRNLQPSVFTFKPILFPSQNKLGLSPHSLSSSTLSLNQGHPTPSANTPIRAMSRLWLNKPPKKADVCTECHIVLNGANIT